ncbi:MAG: hypothetical protein PHU25_10955 [Deltaproteobacteria bacterium]|nr:hypothetical protein [Deltaproteobacteria bacterium]
MLPAILGCATGERLGASDDDTVGDTGCQADRDCFDGDPCTVDRCEKDGICVNVGVCIGGLLGDSSSVCEGAPEIDGDATVSLRLLAASGPVEAVTPLEDGSTFRLVVREPRRIRVVASNHEGDVILVLLRSCANAATNRLAWGRDIYSATVDPGQYILGVFSNTPGAATLDFHFLRPTPCSEAERIPPNGVVLGTVDGFADDFTGTCQQSGANGHRGDRVFTFTVPSDEKWFVRADLTPASQSSSYDMYLRRGCAGTAADEVACTANGTIQRTHFGVGGLGPGEYYLFVDAAEPEDYDLGEFSLAVVTGKDDDPLPNL